ncbi:MAG: hypothetical protein B1H08_05900 [Candidatus Omnitrophica bacterium 4484_171]|nr:MAG: hypothetical protein B1H08_05900 [Candidatus Omnitrophica bacterium 4484_171]
MKKREIIEGLNEKFISVGTKTVDFKNRITLGRKILKLVAAHAGVEEFQILYGEDGDILLRPMVSIPSKEAWIYRNPNVLKAIRQGLAEAREGKIEKAEDLDKFLSNL